MQSPSDSPAPAAPWPLVRFDEMAQNITERAEPSEADTEYYVGLEHLDPESLKIRRWGSPDQVEATKLRFQPGDIIFGKRRAYQRKLAVAEFEGICSAHAMVLRARPEVALPEFLPFLMQSDMFFDRALSISVGSLSPTINWKSLARQEFPLPPIAEQRRIAEILWAADAAVENWRQSHLTLSTFKSLLLRHLFSNGFNNSATKDTIIGPVPNHWQVLRLQDVCRFRDNERIPIKRADRAKRSGIFPYYGASGIIDWIDGYLFDEPLILLGEDGANLVDRSSRLAFKVEGKIWVNNHAHVLEAKAGHNRDFLVEYLESISYAPYITGTAQPKLTKSACENIPIPVPPLEEQDRIAAIINLLDSGLENSSRHVSASHTLKRRLVEHLVTH